MSQMKRIVSIMVSVLVFLTLLVSIGCAPAAQDVVCSNVAYQASETSVTLEHISDLRPPLAAPRTAVESDVEQITLVCDFQAE